MAISRLLQACAEGDKNNCDELLKICDINSTGTVRYPSSDYHKKGIEIAGTTPVLEAISHGKLELAKYLIDRGANINHVTRDGYTAAHLSAYIWSEEALAWLIVKNGFNMRAKDKNNLDVYDAAKGGAPEFKDWEPRCNAITLMNLAREYVRSDIGLIHAIHARTKRPELVCDEQDHKYLVKIMVEVGGHTAVKNMVVGGGFSGYAYAGSSAYSIAKDEGYQYLIDYFDNYLRKKVEASKPLVSDTLPVTIHINGKFYVGTIPSDKEEEITREVFKLLNIDPPSAAAKPGLFK